MQTNNLCICALSISNIFFLFQKMYLFNETQYMRHCTASRNELNTYVRQYTCTWLIDPEHVTHSVKSLTWFNWFTDNKNIISSVHRPNNTHLKSQVDYGRTLLQIAHIPLQKRGKGGAYVDIIRLINDIITNSNTHPIFPVIVLPVITACRIGRLHAVCVYSWVCTVLQNTSYSYTSPYAFILKSSIFCSHDIHSVCD